MSCYDSFANYIEPMLRWFSVHLDNIIMLTILATVNYKAQTTSAAGYQ